jgi:hypothetical protein
MYPKETFSSRLVSFLFMQAFAERIMPTFGNSNFFGDFLIIMTPISLVLFMYLKALGLNSQNINAKKESCYAL